MPGVLAQLSGVLVPDNCVNTIITLKFKVPGSNPSDDDLWPGRNSVVTKPYYSEISHRNSYKEKLIRRCYVKHYIIFKNKTL